MPIAKASYTIALLIITFVTNIAFSGQISNQQLQSMLDDFRRQGNIVAASMAISFPEETTPRLYFSGSQSSDSEQPLHIGNLSQVDSITKSFIATIALRLQEQGIVSLDDTLGQWMPEYPRWKQLRLRQLMNHTSGIYNYTDSQEMMNTALADPSHYFSAQALIGYALKEDDYFLPGQGWHYSNTNYVLLGQVIEKASGKKIEDLLNALVKSDGLYLNNTSMVEHLLPNSIRDRVVHSYVQMSPNQIIDTTYFSASWLNTAGNIVSNTYDIVQWIRALFEGKVLSKNSLEQLTQLVSQVDAQPINSVSENDPDGYGLGIEAYFSNYSHLGTLWYHSGGGLGYKSLMMWLPRQKIAIAIQYDQIKFNELNDPFSPKKDFPGKILQLIEENY